MPAAQKIVLYIDVVSPWTFVAFTVLQRYKKQWDLDLKVIPINLGYVMKVRVAREIWFVCSAPSNLPFFPLRSFQEIDHRSQ